MTVAPGSDIAGFRVIKELGTGAASVLYLVQDPKSKQIWALKHVKKETEKDQRFLDQTEVEYSVGIQLKHPNIRHVERLIKNRRVLRVSEIYMLLEYVDGQPMDKYPPATYLEAVNIFQQVAEGMLYMHSRGYVHADMKPNNIIVTDKDLAKIIDLGQSCLIGTVKERIQGTMDYIAPEQVHRRAIVPATDVYNLGATMYWAVTGRHIPTAMTDRTGLGIAKDDHQIVKPIAPVEVKPTMPLELSDLIMACVSPSPEDRLTMEAVRNRLQVIHVRLTAAEGMLDSAIMTGGDEHEDADDASYDGIEAKADK